MDMCAHPLGSFTRFQVETHTFKVAVHQIEWSAQRLSQSTFGHIQEIRIFTSYALSFKKEETINMSCGSVLIKALKQYKFSQICNKI